MRSHGLIVLAVASAFLLITLPTCADGALSGAPFPAVDFLLQKPVVDGTLDGGLTSLPVRTFDTVETTSDTAHVSTMSYRLGYTNEGLYLYLETGKERLVGRDRAYQNGDGFHMVLALPTPDGSPTREFLVLACSPMESDGRRAFVWYRNVDLSFRPLRNVECAVHSDRLGAGIELFLPWNSVPPYHPWLQNAIGFNLCYVEASGANEKTYHFALLDEYIQSEQHARLCRLLPFAPPSPDAPAQLAFALERNHCFPSDTLRAIVGGISRHHPTATIDVTLLKSDSSRSVLCIDAIVPFPPRSATVVVSHADLSPGNYVVQWRSATDSSGGTLPLTVLPSFTMDDWTHRLNSATMNLSPGSAATLQFLLDQISHDLGALHRYDTGRDLPGRIQSLDTLLRSAGRGDDQLAHRTGVVRRAYRSLIDGTLQPYSLKIPRRVSHDTPVPLIVYLHGSGEDDRGQFDQDTSDDGYLWLAPNGRGTSNVYTTDHAQDDIREAVNDVCRNYAVDTARIILSGFSMGGYGVYRTFIETPRRFRALAIFSGSPNLASRWLGPGHPDFTEPSMLAPFRGVPMFIVHGGRDRNCPVGETDELVENLRRSGAIVEYHREDDRGHEAPSDSVRQRYRAWITEQLTIVDGH